MLINLKDNYTISGCFCIKSGILSQINPWRSSESVTYPLNPGCRWLEVGGCGSTGVTLTTTRLLYCHLGTNSQMAKPLIFHESHDLHLCQRPIELHSVLVVTPGEGDHPLSGASLPAALAVLAEPRPEITGVLESSTYLTSV